LPNVPSLGCDLKVTAHLPFCELPVGDNQSLKQLVLHTGRNGFFGLEEIIQLSQILAVIIHLKSVFSSKAALETHQFVLTLTHGNAELLPYKRAIQAWMARQKTYPGLPNISRFASSISS